MKIARLVRIAAGGLAVLSLSVVLEFGGSAAFGTGATTISSASGSVTQPSDNIDWP
ncbi:hypothetical protein ACIRJR_07435 [Streptomyces sp. NPDC102402]|uniref:hypothetical protein n=1 Tax=Streptomyces sp. NPDC102402 TaxID=3366169 RepID=UPI00381DDE54